MRWNNKNIGETKNGINDEEETWHQIDWREEGEDQEEGWTSRTHLKVWRWCWRSCGSMWKQTGWRLPVERTWCRETLEDCEEMNQCLWRPLQTALDKEKWKSQRRKWRQLCEKEAWFCTFWSFSCGTKQSGHLQRLTDCDCGPSWLCFQTKTIQFRKLNDGFEPSLLPTNPCQVKSWHLFYISAVAHTGLN